MEKKKTAFQQCVKDNSRERKQISMLALQLITSCKNKQTKRRRGKNNENKSQQQFLSACYRPMTSTICNFTTPTLQGYQEPDNMHTFLPILQTLQSQTVCIPMSPSTFFLFKILTTMTSLRPYFIDRNQL